MRNGALGMAIGDTGIGPDEQGRQAVDLLAVGELERQLRRVLGVSFTFGPPPHRLQGAARASSSAARNVAGSTAGNR